MEATTKTSPTVLTAPDVDSVPVEPLGHVDGVAHRVLWQTGDAIAGLMTVAAGRRLGKHAHRINHHHVWVVDGHATVLGRLLGPGSYVHIPAGVAHDVDATETDGCTVFYLYAPPGS